MQAFENPLAEQDPSGSSWEFDAPQFYDFCAGSPPGADASAWFDVQASKQLGCRSPLVEVQQYNGNACNHQHGTGSQTPKGAPSAGPLHPIQLTNPPASAPPPTGVPTAPKTQPRNIVTSWAGKENTSTKKKLEHQPQSHQLPPKSASKRPPQTPAQPQTQTVEAVPEPMQVDHPQGHPALDVQEGAQHRDAGQQGAVGQSPPAKRAAHAQPCHTASKAQRVSMQQHSRFEPRITRSATKAKRETPCPDEASKSEAPEESLRAAMAKARATRSAKTAAAAAVPALGPAASAPDAHTQPSTSAKQPTGTGAHHIRAAKAMHPKPKQAGPASRPHTTTATTTAKLPTQAGPGRGQRNTSSAGTRSTRAAAMARGTRQAAGAAVGRQAQGQGMEAGGSQVGAAVGPAALRTRAAQRSRQANSGPTTKADARSARLSLGVTRGSGVAKVKGSASGGTTRTTRTDPLKLKKMLQARKVLPIRSTKPLTLPEEPVLGPRRSRRNSSQEPETTQKTPFKPLAVRVQEFHTRTPPRHKAKPAPAAAQRPLSMTQPKEPTLRTSSRLRACYAKSREEEELQAMANMPKFHARPLK
ncbi:hypothetical protein DUNSADRAFT_6987 [Dunaliella salina]|uniref:TPX2 central domain-containing protein n=1 Tax=Dunaliella salina TaxID=3046 RepID=A0ABQ7GM92_DUNSA|nr:hypothetical protein DUNSADRAFT_6987 [Dunaliella salina]|eukprot:KAF5835708.1 hypothetical protein DUNSADRAFT_6987 [Dunaliella salina]